jgi:hypothetical protein
MRIFSKSAIAAAAISAALALAGPAHATVFVGQVWNAVDISSNNPIPTTPSMQSTQALNQDITNGTFNIENSSLAAFTATAINFGVSGTNQNKNTFGNFFNDSTKTNPNNFQYIFPNALDANIDGIELSGPGKGDTFLTYISITTSFTGPATLSLLSDDASVVYVDGVQEMSENGGAATDILNVIGAGLHTIELDYVETDGAPDSLAFAVPEPASLALFGMGLFGLAAFRRRQSR